MTSTDHSLEPTTTGTELAVRSHSDLVALDEFMTILTTGEVPEQDVFEDPEAISRQIIAQILAAPDDDAMFQAVESGAVGWREYKGKPVEIRGFRWRLSDFEEGSPVFVIVSAVDLDTGEMLALTTGASNVLAQLASMAHRGTLVGQKVTLMEADNATKAGYRPLKLVPAA